MTGLSRCGRVYPYGGAIISEGGAYRYQLTRRWADGAAVTWIMLNPSTADERLDDPTIRRCIGFSRSWGYGGLIVVNLFALRSPNPRRLIGHVDPVGPENDHYIIEAARSSSLVIAAWGAHSIGHRRGKDATNMIMTRAVPVHLACLGLTKAGHPRHPLYVRSDQPLVSLS